MVETHLSHAKDHLGKTFHFSEDSSSSGLSDALEAGLFTQERWACPERLATLKAELNASKSLLNRLPLAAWHVHTKNSNPAADVAATIKHNGRPELLTQAWCKFHEIFNAFDLHQHSDQHKFHTVHLCEAPGAFVAALNHNLRQRQQQQLESQEEPRRTEQTAEAPQVDSLDTSEKTSLVKSLEEQQPLESDNHGFEVSVTKDSADEKACLLEGAGPRRHGHGQRRLKAAPKQSPPGLDWHWRATTLNPFYEGNHTGEMINDDRLILHTLRQWDFGADDSGDLLLPLNRLAWARSLRRCCADEPISLVTADGSIDCQCDPARQEEIVAPLHLAEAALALALLAGSDGGNFVLKMFTFYECSSVCLLYLLVKAFKQVSIFKPGTSKEGNSEVYVVCRAFRDNLSAAVIQSLLENAHTKERALFPQSAIPNQFVQEVMLCAEKFKNYQVAALERNLSSFSLASKNSLTVEASQTSGCNSPSEEVKLLRSLVASEFLRLYPVHPISNLSRIVPAGASLPRANHCLNLDRRDAEVGTFEDRVLASAFIDRQRLREEIWTDLRCNWVQFRKVEWLPAPTPPSAFTKVVYGRPLAEVFSSKFCPGKAFRLHRRAFEATTEGNSALHSSHSKAKKARRFGANGSDPPIGTLVSLEDLLSSVPILSNLAKLYPEIKGKTMVLRMAKDLEPCIFDIGLLASRVSMLRTVFSQLEVGEHLVLMELSCLTRLEVALLHIAAGCFTELGLVRPQGCHAAVFLSEFKASKDGLKLLQDFEALLEKTPSDKETQLLQAFEITEMVQEPLYPFLVAYNVISLREKSLFILREKP